MIYQKYLKILILITIISPTIVICDVLCGEHRAETCSKCIHGFTNSYMRKFLWYAWCNEDCKYDLITELCHDKGSFMFITSKYIKNIRIQLV